MIAPSVEQQGRVCRRCQRQLPLESFAEILIYPTRNPARRNICRTCETTERWEREQRRTTKRKVAPEKAKQWTAVTRAKNPMMRAAHTAVDSALRRGILSRPEACPKCGRSELRIEAHHHDYTKPLEVEWLCSLCHGETRRIYK